MFEQRVLPITEDIMFKWRLVVAEGRKVGHTFSQPDLIIAATGLHHGFTVVTRDTDDFVKARAAVFNPWIDPLPIAQRLDKCQIPTRANRPASPQAIGTSV